MRLCTSAHPSPAHPPLSPTPATSLIPFHQLFRWSGDSGADWRDRGSTEANGDADQARCRVSGAARPGRVCEAHEKRLYCESRRRRCVFSSLPPPTPSLTATEPSCKAELTRYGTHFATVPHPPSSFSPAPIRLLFSPTTALARRLTHPSMSWSPLFKASPVLDALVGAIPMLTGTSFLAIFLFSHRFNPLPSRQCTRGALSASPALRRK
jgi:hypothetical protein